jgi:hypothetical protein
MLLVISILIYLILSYAITLRINKVVSISEWAIYLFITVIGSNILIVEILNIFKELNNPSLFLITQGTLITAILFFIIDPWKRIYKEKLPRPNIKLQKVGISEIVLQVIIFSIIIFVLYVGSLGPISNSDSLSTHLVRIFYWLQHNSLESWDATVIAQISYPINISIQGLWVFLLTSNEMNFFLIPFFALVMAIVLIYKISMILGAKPVGGLISSLLSLSFPVVLLQTYSYQGDVFIATLALCALYFLLLFIKNSSQISIYISILIISISIGAKQTILLFVPVFGLVILVLVFQKKIAPRLLLKIIGLFVISFLIFSSFKFIQNSRETHVENSAMVDPKFFGNLFSLDKKPIQGYMTNGLRYLYQAVSLDGVTGQLKLDLQAAKNGLFQRISEKLSVDLESDKYLSKSVNSFSYSIGIPICEDATWFGITSIPVIVIAILVTLFSKSKLRKGYLVFSLLLLALFIFGQVVLKTGWGPYRGRHMIISVLVLMPLVSFIVPKNRWLGGVVAAVFAVMAVYLSLSILIFNDVRPLVTQLDLVKFREFYINKIEVTNIINSQYRIRLYKLTNDLIKTEVQERTILHGDYDEKILFQNSDYLKDIELINLKLSENQPLFIFITPSPLEYSLFGRNVTRELYPILNLNQVRTNSYVLVSRNLVQDINGFNLSVENSDYMILFKP